MTDSNYENSQGQRNFRNNDDNNYRNRYGGKRESGGFRIRLSDNEICLLYTSPSPRDED